VNGIVDPWHHLSILQEKRKDQHVIFIQGTSHCQDMHSSKESDSFYLKDARKLIDDEVQRWLDDFARDTSHRHDRRQTVE
jgi:hypothetical protein